jgi:hypothetical protein
MAKSFRARRATLLLRNNTSQAVWIANLSIVKPARADAAFRRRPEQ